VDFIEGSFSLKVASLAWDITQSAGALDHRRDYTSLGQQDASASRECDAGALSFAETDSEHGLDHQLG
jgi:hypothetical protein